jgi:undecaprenyl-phosphate galactose phosphotransferase
MSKMPYKIIKRVSDIILSLLLLILFSPFLLLASLLIWFGDRSEICVRDPLRIGLGGKEFRMYKFRTMIPNAHREILENPEYEDLKKKWEVNGNKLKIEEDIRITKIGRLLRRTDLDELPQLVNVLMGHMSIVGPRPMYKDELERHLKTNPEDEKYLNNILSVRPGITGLWQVSGRNEIPFGKRLKMDAEYSQEQNLLLDMKILLKTPYVVLTRKGAYE